MASHFKVYYRLSTTNTTRAEIIARDICIEQTVEMPWDVVPDHIKPLAGTVEKLEQIDDNAWMATIQYASSLAGRDPGQLLNLIFGNSSLIPGIQVIDIDDDILLENLNGPAFGIKGIRNLIQVHQRPLSCTALKPVGLSPGELADRAFLFSKGGIDIIKDDHGLASQPFAEFTARVTACVHAIKKGSAASGKKTLYFPNITTSPQQAEQRYRKAVELGADGVLISPGLTGLETMHSLARIGEIPVMAHPALSGPFVIHPNHGFTPSLYFGKLWRAFGADAVIYPNYGGRFQFSKDQCLNINQQARRKMGIFNASFPTPGGGINRNSIAGWIEEYGKDTIFLVGGSLYQHGDGIEAAASEFQKILEDNGK